VTYVVFRLFAILSTMLICGSDDARFSRDSYFAICLVVKDYNDYIVEWIEYHKRMGCGRFYIYDHGTEVPMLETIKEYVLSGLVEYTYTDYRNWDPTPQPQLQTYDKCVRSYGQRHRWMGFIDSDEFIVVVNKSLTIPDVLRGYEDYGGVGLTWMRFGSSGHIQKPPGGVLPNYYKCAPHFNIKSIINPAVTSHADRDPHHFIHTGSKYTVSTSFVRIDGPRNPDFSKAFDVMYINHYHTKSLDDYIDKLRRGRAVSRNHLITMADFYAVDALCVNNCTILEMPPPR
jgi:hypothetical protein